MKFGALIKSYYMLPVISILSFMAGDFWQEKRNDEVIITIYANLIGVKITEINNVFETIQAGYQFEDINKFYEIRNEVNKDLFINAACGLWIDELSDINRDDVASLVRGLTFSSRALSAEEKVASECYSKVKSMGLVADEQIGNVD